LLFKVFVNVLDTGIKSTLGNFADDTQLGGPVDCLDCREALQ